MRKSLLALLLSLSLVACGGSSSPVSRNPIPVPNIGQWVAFGGNEPFITQGPQPSWPIPCCNGTIVAGYFYTNLGVVPQAGQSVMLTYTYTANSPVYVQKVASGGNSQTDINPPTIHLFVWKRGDDLTCQGAMVDARLFGGGTNLVPGANQTITVPLSTFTNCYGKPPANLQDTLNNLIGIGVTFGGQWFAGHGLYLSNGNATFTVNSLTIK